MAAASRVLASPWDSPREESQGQRGLVSGQVVRMVMSTVKKWESSRVLSP